MKSRNCKVIDYCSAAFLKDQIINTVNITIIIFILAEWD